MVKNPPAMEETQVQSLGWEDPLEKGMAAVSSILAWRIPWREEPGGKWGLFWLHGAGCGLGGLGCHAQALRCSMQDTVL